MEKWEYWKDENVKKRFLSKVQVGEEDQCWFWRAGRFATCYRLRFGWFEVEQCPWHPNKQR